MADRVLDEQRMVWQWYVKSRDAGAYKQMVKDQLYHPPHITVDPARTKNGKLHLVHHFEGLPLVVIEAMACGCRVVITELPGLDSFYMAGQWVMPGGGVPAL